MSSFPVSPRRKWKDSLPVTDSRDLRVAVANVARAISEPDGAVREVLVGEAGAILRNVRADVEGNEASLGTPSRLPDYTSGGTRDAGLLWKALRAVVDVHYSLCRGEDPLLDLRVAEALLRSHWKQESGEGEPIPLEDGEAGSGECAWEEGWGGPRCTTHRIYVSDVGRCPVGEVCESWSMTEGVNGSLLCDTHKCWMVEGAPRCQVGAMFDTFRGELLQDLAKRLARQETI